MSVNDIQYDRQDVVNNLKAIADELVRTAEDDEIFTWYADDILHAVDYFIARLADEQTARFK